MRMRTINSIILLLLVPTMVWGQHRASADVQTVTVAKGKKMTVTKSIYLSPDGRMVTEQHRPQRMIFLTNALGEMRIYNPADNSVVLVDDRELASDKDLLAVFATGRYVDMDLPLYGYVQSGVEQREGLTIKTFEPKTKNKGVEKVELAFDRHLPICMIYYGTKDNAVRKLYFSKYNLGRIPMPMRITEVEYTTPTDSLVRLSTYSNLVVGGEATSEMFDFVVPADAKMMAFDKSMLEVK